jgi:hypothetical protein
MSRRGPRAFHSRSDCGRQLPNDLTFRCAPHLHKRVGLSVHTNAVSAVEDVHSELHSELGELDDGAAIVKHRSLVVDGELKDALKRA